MFFYCFQWPPFTSSLENGWRHKYWINLAESGIKVCSFLVVFLWAVQGHHQRSRCIAAERDAAPNSELVIPGWDSLRILVCWFTIKFVLLCKISPPKKNNCRQLLPHSSFSFWGNAGEDVVHGWAWFEPVHSWFAAKTGHSCARQCILWVTWSFLDKLYGGMPILRVLGISRRWGPLVQNLYKTQLPIAINQIPLVGQPTV